jgi:transcriptional regulator with XRE-family HTH domain
MDLATWMNAHGKRDQEIADAVGVTRPYINRIKHGEVHPNLGVALAIYDFTGGQIDLRQLLPRGRRPEQVPTRLRGRPRLALVAAPKRGLFGPPLSTEQIEALIKGLTTSLASRPWWRRSRQPYLRGWTQ